MRTPTVADVILKTKMNLPEVQPYAPQSLNLGQFVPPVVVAEPVPRTFIPDDLDLSDLKAPEPDAVSALLSTKMTLPRCEKSPDPFEQLLATKMEVPVMRPEQPPCSFIPADVDLSIDPVVKEPTVADQIMRTPFSLLVMTRPQSVAERILSAPMTLPGGSFADAAAQVRPEVARRQISALERSI